MREAQPRGGLVRRFESLGGRLVFVVCTTLAATACATLGTAAWLWSQQMERLQRANFAEAIADIHDRLLHDPAAFKARLHSYHFRHYALQPYPWPRDGVEDARLRTELVNQFGPYSDPHVVRIDDKPRCIQPPSLQLHEYIPQFGCWYVRFQFPSGTTWRLEIDRDSIRNYNFPVAVPVYLLVIGAESVVLAIVISRLTLAPLRRLRDASGAFARSLDPALVPETGPHEIRMALHTFNVMQQRVRDGFVARSNFLEAIGHDLQTPLTRMRIRLEQVEDVALRHRLLGDLGIMLATVRGGLELASTGDSREAWAVVEIGTLLESVATDAQDAGQDVTFEPAPDLHARVKPNALLRALQNLCDNASRHAGSANLRAEAMSGAVRIFVEDRGPGLPEDSLERVFAPFVRLTERGEGTGLGLAIARALASTFGATVTLANRPEGGLRAVLSIPGAD